MKVELQQLPVYAADGTTEESVWVPIVAGAVIDRQHHSSSVKGVKRFLSKQYPDTEIEFSVHPQCQKQNGRRKPRSEK